VRIASVVSKRCATGALNLDASGIESRTPSAFELPEGLDFDGREVRTPATAGFREGLRDLSEGTSSMASHTILSSNSSSWIVELQHFHGELLEDA
jgi:hypothetical protein